MVRTAIIDRPRGVNVRTVQTYLPQSYHASQQDDGSILITGTDVAGWTLDEYVIPRLASGLLFATETTKGN